MCERVTTVDRIAYWAGLDIHFVHGVKTREEHPCTSRYDRLYCGLGKYYKYVVHASQVKHNFNTPERSIYTLQKVPTGPFNIEIISRAVVRSDVCISLSSNVFILNLFVLVRVVDTNT